MNIALDHTNSEGFNTEENPEIILKSYEPNDLYIKLMHQRLSLWYFRKCITDPGWQAYLDGEGVDHIRANYILRAMNIPAGEHTAIFKFEPEVINTGSSIALASSVILFLAIFFAFFASGQGIHFF